MTFPVFVGFLPHMKRFGVLIIVAAAALFFVPGCGLKKVTTATVGRIATDGVTVLESEQDLELARNSTPTLIMTLEVLSKGKPDDRGMLTLLARAYGQYAFGFLEEDLLKYKDGDHAAYNRAYERADRFYKKGMDYGLAALWPEKSRKKVLSLSQDAFEKELHRFGKRQASSLFWAAFTWGNWINLHRDDIEAVADVPRVEAMVKRVVKLVPDYYYGSAHSFLGTIASSKPAMLGGDKKLAEDEFNAALGVCENYLMTKVLYAQYYAVQFQDRPLYGRLLEEVRGADAKAFPEQRLANELAKRRAAILIEREKKYF